MSEEEGPKLFTNKPRKTKKAQVIKASQAAAETVTAASTSAGSAAAAAAASSYKMGSPPPPPPPQPPQESFARRYKFLWPLLLTVNLAVGAYLFMRTKKSDAVPDKEVTPKVSSTPVAAAPTAPVAEKPTLSPAVVEPVKIREPIPEDQQRELFKWILEERRKVKPKDPEEKKQIDEEKALLKQVIRAKSIPRI